MLVERLLVPLAPRRQKMEKKVSQAEKVSQLALVLCEIMFNLNENAALVKVSSEETPRIVGRIIAKDFIFSPITNTVL